MEDRNILIEVENLKYRYPHTEELALKGVSFRVRQGEFIGVVGANKAGKSTLTQALMGLVPQFYKGAYGGRVLVDGKEADKTPIDEICKSVGLVFQNPFNQLSGAKDSVYEEIAFGLQNMGIAPEEMRRRIDAAMTLLDIAQYRDKNPFDLSGGQMQRVAIASILVMEPKIFVLDEPTSQLDPAGTEEVFKAVLRLAKAGKTIIMVEQKPEKLAAYCDRILLMADGQVVDFDTPERIFSRNDLEQIGVQPPVYTRLARAQGWCVAREGDVCIYPVRQEEMAPFREPLAALVRELTGAAAPRRDEKAAGRTVFEVKGVTFSYDKGAEGRRAIDGLSLSLDGRATAIVGQNGAGKTTLVKLLKGLLKPVGGSILYDGADISGRTVASLAGAVGYVFQSPDDQIFKSRVLDEVMFGPLNIGMDKAAAREKSLAALRTVGLEDAAGKNPYDLELAERKLVAVASVLSMDTRVIIFDEPTIAQDYCGRETMKRIIRELTAQGKLVIAILHDMDFVADCFARVVVMAHGRILADGTPEEVFAQERILEEARIERPHAAAMCSALGLEGFVRLAV
ncbi:MAG: energy-coupling factor transporter ATPase [Roseburia sp.]|nr:energy-coupling factor transporter ATPase [Roseburia sp.]